MKLHLLAITGFLASGVVSYSCNDANWFDCDWYGSSPFCGSTDAKIGDTDSDGLTLVNWTKDTNLSGYCYSQGPREMIPEDNCCLHYGAGCWSGYKRLWCKRIK